MVSEYLLALDQASKSATFSAVALEGEKGEKVELVWFGKAVVLLSMMVVDVC